MIQSLVFCQSNNVHATSVKAFANPTEKCRSLSSSISFSFYFPCYHLVFDASFPQCLSLIVFQSGLFSIHFHSLPSLSRWSPSSAVKTTFLPPKLLFIASLIVRVSHPYIFVLRIKQFTSLSLVKIKVFLWLSRPLTRTGNTGEFNFCKISVMQNDWKQA